MKSTRYLVTALGAAVAVAGLAQAAPAFADNSSNPNEVAYWEAQLGDGTVCYKDAYGTLTDGGKSVTLDAGGWLLLVVNSGAAGPDGNGNLVYRDPAPAAGHAYFGPLNGGGQQGAVSHWIVCGTVETPTTTEAPTTTETPTTETPTTTEAPTTTETPTTSEAPTTTETPTTTEAPSTTETPTTTQTPTTTETPTTTAAPTTTTEDVQVESLSPTTTQTPGADPQQESEAPTTSVTPTSQLPKTGNDHVTLYALIAALLLGGGVTLSAVAARRRN